MTGTLEPQAFALARVSMDSESHYRAGVVVAHMAMELLQGAHEKGQLRIAPNATVRFDTLRETLDEMPETEDQFISQQLALADRSRFLPQEYGLKM